MSGHPHVPLAPARNVDVVSEPTRTSRAGVTVTGDARPTAESVPGALVRRYRQGAAVTVLAKELGVSFDWVARRIIATGTRRDQLPPRRTRRRPAELDSDQWLSDQLAGGAGVRDLSRRLHVAPSTVRNALRHYAARRADGSVGTDVCSGASDPEGRFAAATKRIERANLALERANLALDRASLSLERAQRLQASAVSDLHAAGLTVAAVADRLGIDVNLVETLLATDAALDSPERREDTARSAGPS